MRSFYSEKWSSTSSELKKKSQIQPDWPDEVSLIKTLEGRISNDLSIKLDTAYNLAFKLYPTNISQVLSFAEKKKYMPQKSTWFHPKPLDGLISSNIIS